MNLVSLLLDRARTLLFGRAERSAFAGTEPPSGAGPRWAGPVPSPEMWAAVLAGARRRRAPHLFPAATSPAATDDVGAPVRPYVLPPQERARVLATAAGEVR
ncbi:hypothetical protein GCM10010383_48730 [Streptomyces lomondensis]|uniref:Uncharacterized protein n=1 Tax=Streptomyces lomondensis TaxID=68229 RepID=A0ABQ2XF62_9ACTN|nr:hypothetical protein GCM10010383_48730 [Streptomyces lomondensis]